jgi:hypothetical protein
LNADLIVLTDGLAVIVYQASTQGAALSMSNRADVAAGQGAVNWLPGNVHPFVLTDDDLGDAITLPWYFISGVAGVTIQLIEYLYDE